MREIRIHVKCSATADLAQELQHGKMLVLRGSVPGVKIRGQAGHDLALALAEALAQLIDGTSSMYLNKPGPRSPIGTGVCAVCGAPLMCEIKEIDRRE